MLSSPEYLFILRNSYIETTISKLIKAIYFLARNQTWQEVLEETGEKNVRAEIFLLRYLFKKIALLKFI